MSTTIPELHIAGRRIASDAPAFVIAEIGVNHDGSVDTALRLVEAAQAAGADAVKLQLFKASRLMHRGAQLAEYQRAAGATDPAAMLRQYELDGTAVAQIVAAIRDAGLVPLATPFSPEDIAEIATLDLPAVKLASPDLVNSLLIDTAASLSLPMLLSTGAATGDEVAWAVDRLRRRGADFALLHCVSAYPTPVEQAQIGWVREVVERFDVVAGYSDHTQDLSAGAIALAAGARIIEKHLTHDRAALGPDHAASADPQQFAEYVTRIRQTEALLGTGGRRTQEIEQDVRTVSRQSLVLRRPIMAGQGIRREDLTCQRPGTGIAARYVDEVIGSLAARDLAAGEMLAWGDVHQVTGKALSA